MDRDWMFDLAAVIRDLDISHLGPQDNKRFVLPRRARSWYDVYKLMRAGFIMITELDDGSIELRDWGDTSDKPFVFVAPRDKIINMIYSNRFPTEEECDLSVSTGGWCELGSDNSKG